MSVPRLYRRPKNRRFRKWRKTRADGTAFEQPGVGWIVKNEVRGFDFIPFDPSIPKKRCSTLEGAMAAGRLYACSL